MILLACMPSKGLNVTAQTGAGNYVDVGDVKIWYEECGDIHTSGPGVVLLHDGLVHSITWDGVWAPLCDEYHVVRYDRRGYGRSEPSKAPFVPEDDLYRIMRQVHMDRAILIGNSSGAGLALDFALAHPAMVVALFLIGPVVHGMPSSDYFNERGSKNNEPLARGDRKATAENWSKDRFLIAGDDQPARKKLYDALAQNPQNLTVAGGLELRPSPPTVQRLSQIRVPTLVLVGDADIADVFAYSGAIEAAVPLASFEVWKDTDHLVQIQKPVELVARFNRFFSLATREEVDLAERKLAIYTGQYTCFNGPCSVMLRDKHLVFEISGEPHYWAVRTRKQSFSCAPTKPKSNSTSVPPVMSLRWLFMTEAAACTGVYGLRAVAASNRRLHR